ncbi:MAG: AAA domain-containing protein [Saprospiraceae bacterium]|nr:AAA domain-containing protein [Saprospiraceae bacterium]
MSNPHFVRLLQLLRQEREEDQREYLRQVRERPLAERVEQGYAWYPLLVVQTGFALGEKAFVLVERTTRLHEPHQLRAGQSVNFFTTTQHVEQPERTGIIHFVERNRLKIILQARDVPDWINQGQLGVEQLFDDRSYQEMERALLKVMQAKGDRLAELRDLLTGTRHPESRPTELSLEPASSSFTEEAMGLNASQHAAVQAILENPNVAVIHGPPGTGKTTTLVAAIRLLCERESTVLVTAPSNTAADLLTERLATAGLNVVRIGNVSRVDEHILPHTLDAILARHPESRNIRKVKMQAAEWRRQTQRHKRTFSGEDRREREHLKQQVRELEAWATTLEARLVEQILTSAQAITCTLVGAANPLLERYKFRTCVMDEAAQALEPAAWIPILKCSRVVLAGDPFQLPPTVKSQDAAKQGLSITLIERCLELIPHQVHLLTVQYRMHQAIMDFSNQYFYGGALQAHESVRERLLSAGHSTTPYLESVIFIDTAGTGFEEKINRRTGKDSSRYQSKYNPEEALLVREHLLQLLPKFPASTLPSFGILSPYREQVNYLEQLVREDATLAPLLVPRTGEVRSGLAINTIDGFQGQERDVIYISLVRSNNRHEIGFLSDYRRMNVAMTRARMLLVVIGDSATIGNNPFYKAFLDYCAERGLYQTAWAYLQ